MSSGVAFVSGLLGVVVGALLMSDSSGEDLDRIVSNLKVYSAQTETLQEKVDDLELELDDLKDRLGIL